RERFCRRDRERHAARQEPGGELPARLVRPGGGLKAQQELSPNCHQTLIFSGSARGAPRARRKISCPDKGLSLAFVRPAKREDGMQITILDDAGTTARVVLNGKLDISGAEKIALPLATLAGGKRGVLVDMAAVTFVASIGIRHLVMASKAL